MSTQQIFELPTRNESSLSHEEVMTEKAPDPVLSESVAQAVNGYLKAMEDEPITDLYDLVLSEIEVPLLECILNHTHNNQSLTAQMLGLNRGTLRKKLKKYGML